MAALVTYLRQCAGAICLVAISPAWLGRGMYRTKTAPNPMDQDRDYSLRPVAKSIAKSVSSFALAMLWALGTAYASRLGYIPDTWFGVAVIFGPALALLVVSAVYLFNALGQFQLGSRRPGS